LYYTDGVVDWSKRHEYIVRKRGVTADHAEEALADPAAIVFDPDYNSDSGESVRTIGESPSCGDVLTVITVEHEGAVYGVNAWRSNPRDRNYYKHGGRNEGNAR